MSELTGLEVQTVDTPLGWSAVQLAWSTTDDPGRRATMPASTARRIAARLLDAADDADQRNAPHRDDDAPPVNLN